MTDDATERTSPAAGPSEPRPTAPVRRPLRRRAAARTAGWLRGFWYRFQRLFGLDSCPIDQGPDSWRHPNPPSPGGRARRSSGNEAPETRSGRGMSP